MKRNLQSIFGKGIIVLFFLGFILGSILINTLGKEYLNQAGILSDYFLRQYKYMEINSLDLFFYITEKRIKWEILLWILGYTVIGVPAVITFVIWFGFAAGTLLSISVLKMGIKGVVFCVGAMIPQMLIYVPAWIFLMYIVYKKRGQRNYSNGNYILAGIAVCAVTLAGIFAESYISPWIIRQILRIF